MLLKLPSLSQHNSLHLMNVFFVFEPLNNYNSKTIKKYIRCVLLKFFQELVLKMIKKIFTIALKKVFRMEQTDKHTNTHSIIYI